jgi:NitT/TauT family transport system ATP-binding protein
VGGVAATGAATGAALLLRICSLSKSFGDRQVLKDFSCSLPKGKTICIFGPSGQGKTTLLRILMSLETADGGGVEWYERPRISAVFQEDRLCTNLSALANCVLVMDSRLSRSEAKATALAALGRVGLAGHEHRPVRELSGGQSRRVALVRALVAEYGLLLLDEPFKGLDQRAKDAAIAYVKERTREKTVLLVTHDMAEAAAMGAEIVAIG